MFLKAPSANILLVAALPALTMHICLFASALQGHIELCNPYWADCVSVSRTGRHGAGYVVFKAGMIPSAFLLGFFWQHSVISLSKQGNLNPQPLTFIAWAASCSLLIYTVALGHTGDTFYLLRRFGVVLFIALTFIVQVKVGQALKALPQFATQGRISIGISLFILFIAIGSLGLDALLGADYDRIENAFEWWLITLLIGHMFFLGLKTEQRQTSH